MQIPPSPSVLQALGTPLSPPETMRQAREAMVPEAVPPPRDAAATGDRPEADSGRPGARLDIKV
jgi:hypothetical protein